jgi:hypothetical protein
MQRYVICISWDRLVDVKRLAKSVWLPFRIGNQAFTVICDNV